MLSDIRDVSKTYPLKYIFKKFKEMKLKPTPADNPQNAVSQQVHKTLAEAVKAEEYTVSPVSTCGEIFGEIAQTSLGAAILRAFIDERSRIPEPDVMLSYQGEEVLSRRGMYAITGKGGSRKTSALTLLTSLLIGGNTEQAEEARSYGWEVPRPYRVLYCDMEQRDVNTQRLIDRLRRLIDPEVVLADDYPEFRKHCRVMNGVTLADIPLRRAVITEAVRRAAEEGNPYDVVIIDPLTDLVKDANDMAEADAFVADLRRWSSDWEIALIGVIHGNEGSANNKPRGHIGSTFVRRADGVWCATDCGQYSRISKYKLRNALGQDWHVSIDAETHLPQFYSPTEAENSAAAVRTVREAKYRDFVSSLPVAPATITPRALKTALIQYEHERGNTIAERTAELQISGMVTMGLLTRTGDRKNSLYTRPAEAENQLPF